MDVEETLSRGLLGHWRGERSPDGIVRDRSPEGNHGNYGIDTRWIWFTNPRAIRHEGRQDRTYLTYLGGPTGRDLVVAAYDHDTGEYASTVIEDEFSADDHTNPALYLGDDGHILAFWTGHNGEAIYYRVSSDPESIDRFEAVRTIEQESVTYPNPVRSPDGESLYLFFRDRVHTRDATDDRWGYMGDGNLYCRVSHDGGDSWSEQTRLVTPPDGHYSMYFVPARGADAIHFFFTDAERGGDAPKWNVMYGAFRDDGFFSAAGEELVDANSLPATRDDLEVVYDSSAEGNDYAWIWDAALDADDRPVAAYATFPSTLTHEYRWARWDGDTWQDHRIADAGRYIARRPIELHYSGGLSLDREDPTVVYGSVADEETATLRRFETATGGETWAEMTVSRRPVGCDIRPVVPHNASEEIPVLWLTGSYKHMDTSQTVLRGLPSNHLRGESLTADGRRGVDLGFDLYDEATFKDGFTVSATVSPLDVANRGVIANFGGAITVGTALDGEPGIGVSIVSTDETVTLTGSISPVERAHVAARWNRADRFVLAINGEAVDERTFTGPVTIEDEWASWTLLKGTYLIDDGYIGDAADIRLYDRPLPADAIQALADRV